MSLFVWRTKQFRSNARQKRDREFATAPAQSCHYRGSAPHRLYRRNLVNSPSSICTVDGAERRRAGGNFPLIRIEHRATNFRVPDPGVQLCTVICLGSRLHGLLAVGEQLGDYALIEFSLAPGRIATRARSRCLARASLHYAPVLHQLLVVLVVNLLRFHRGLERLPGLHDALIDACAFVLELVRGLNLRANSQ
jgi:hypothetical protein